MEPASLVMVGHSDRMRKTLTRVALPLGARAVCVSFMSLKDSDAPAATCIPAASLLYSKRLPESARRHVNQCWDTEAVARHLLGERIVTSAGAKRPVSTPACNRRSGSRAIEEVRLTVNMPSAC